MKCPFCAHAETQVVETRLGEDASLIRRRRRCNSCDKRFTTYERPEVNFPVVVKKDGRRVDFERSKLEGSFALALRKRPVSADIIAAAIERISTEMAAIAKMPEVVQTLSNAGIEAIGGSAADCHRAVLEEVDRLGKAVAQAGIQKE